MIRGSEEDRIAALRARIEEMRRRTVSSLTVTNSGVEYLKVASGRITLRDGSGGPILSTAPAPAFGYTQPLQNYTVFPVLPPATSDAFQGPFVNTMVTRFRPNQPRIEISTTTEFFNDIDLTSTGIADWQLVYTVNGGAPITIPGSSGSLLAWGTTTQTYSYTWPADYFSSIILLQFQARIRPGTGTVNDGIGYAPSRLYGRTL